MTISASTLYNHTLCPHRTTMDHFGNPQDKDEPNAFIQLLWERGNLHEQSIADDLPLSTIDLHTCSPKEKRSKTMEAIESQTPLIYSGRIETDNLVGEPDLLRREGNLYLAGDIKSGAGLEGTEDLSKPKAHYAVQLAFYTDILERLGLSAGRKAFLIDGSGEEIEYDFDQLYGKRNPRTLWQDYQEVLTSVEQIIQQQQETLPAYASGVCKLCSWYTACQKRLIEADDLTLIPELGRSKRDVLYSDVKTISEFAETDPELFKQPKNKTIFPGIGSATLDKFHSRAVLLSQGENAKPYLREPISLVPHEKELFFDIEVDPLNDICYLHGFVERIRGEVDQERFVYFFTEEMTEESEHQAFQDAWNYIQSSQPCMTYYYSKYERTLYRNLREKYPSVCSEDELEDFFGEKHSVDLYFDVVLKATEWPTKDFSIKTLAQYLGFNWRDTHPSGAASIEWFQKWIESGDPSIKQRILDYNEDDCIATRVLLDGILALELNY